MPEAYGPSQYNSVNSATYKAGRTYRETWNKGVFGPAFPKDTQWAQEGINRVGNELQVGATMWGDAQGRLGFPSALVGQFSRLTRNGETVFSGPAFGGTTELPAGDAEYKLLINLGQHPLAGLSTTNTATWTFRSAETPEDTVTKLPVSAVRFLPELDENNAAAPGDYDLIPFQVQRQPGAATALTSAFEMTVSYDEGRTWLKPTIQRFGESGVALIKRPAGVTSGFVSLQSKATQTDGGIVEQRILRAFRY
jgi:hypothetical protein